MTSHPERLILASQSPRRAALLQQIGVDFAIQPAAGEEPPPAPDEGPIAYAMRTADHKAAQVQQALQAKDPSKPCTDWIIGADTIVVVDDHILGKPGSPEEAHAMLQRLSDRSHQVITAFAIRHKARDIVHVDSTTTDVWFRALTPGQIQTYTATGEPLDKAGAYGIQGRAALFVKRIEGCYFNVVGLPLGDLMAALALLKCPASLLPH